jgi:hypothetical protein
MPAIVFSAGGVPKRGAQQALESSSPFLSRPCGLPSLRNPPDRDRPEGKACPCGSSIFIPENRPGRNPSLGI